MSALAAISAPITIAAACATPSPGSPPSPIESAKTLSTTSAAPQPSTANRSAFALDEFMTASGVCSQVPRPCPFRGGFPGAGRGSRFHATGHQLQSGMLSTVIPVYNEEDNVQPLHEYLTEATYVVPQAPPAASAIEKDPRHVTRQARYQLLFSSS